MEDKATAEALKPYYRQFCKRPCFHNEYLPTFNHDNVTLVDTQGRGVECVIDKGHSTLEVSEDAEAGWVDTILERARLGGGRRFPTRRST